MFRGLVTLGLSALVTTAALPAMAGVGELYGSREPATCDDTSLPEGDDPMTVDLALKYVACGIEEQSVGYLYLAENIRLKLGKPRRWREAEDYLRTNIDPDAQLWLIKGSYDRYQCSKVADYGDGTNCNFYEKPDASGACWKNLFGEWSCSFSGTDGEVRMNVAAPK